VQINSDDTDWFASMRDFWNSLRDNKIINRADMLRPLCFLLCSFLVLSGCGKEDKNIEAQEQKISSNDRKGKEQETENADEIKTDNGYSAEIQNEIMLSEEYTIGISMPLDECSRWEEAGRFLEAYLCGEGCMVKLQYSESVVEQTDVLEQWIEEEVDLLIVNPVDAYSLAEVLDTAARLGIPVISYHELIMNSSAVSYLIAGNQYVTGKMQAQFYVERNGITVESAESYEVWFVREGEEKGSSKLLGEGLTDTLLPYIDEGVITVQTMDCSMAINNVGEERGALPDCVFCLDTETTVTFEKYLNGEAVLIDGKNLSLPEQKAGKTQLIGVTSKEEQRNTLLLQEDNMTVCISEIKQAEACGKLAKKILLGQTPQNDFLQKEFSEEENKNWSYDRGNYDNGTGIIPAYLLSGEMMRSSF